MAPIYESDVGEERWAKSQWNHYELWEKVEQRLRRHNRLWIAATAVVFVLLSSIPIVWDQSPKWHTLSITRSLGQEINRVKSLAGIEHQAYRIKFAGNGSLDYRIESAATCDAFSRAPGTWVESGSFLPPKAKPGEYVLLSAAQGEKLSVPGLTDEFCYDPLNGSAAQSRGESIIGFGIIPSQDLSESRMDRLSVLLSSGASADVSFE